MIPTNINFNAQHSPMGAFVSFTCGHFGSRGGLAAQIGRPGNQDVYIGIKDGNRTSDAVLRLLPFYEGADKAGPVLSEVAQQAAAAANNFLVEQAPTPAAVKSTLAPYKAPQIRRQYGWATDAWTAGEFTFSIYTPFGEIPDPTRSGAVIEQMALLPAVLAELTVDNTAGHETKTAFFALGFHEGGVRLLDQRLSEGRVGFALRSQLGVAGELFEITPGGDLREVKPGAFPFMRWTPADGLKDPNPIHLLGSCPGIGFEVPPGKKYVLRIALGAFLDGNVTTRLEGKYLYTKYFADLMDVLDDALTMFDSGKAEASSLDRQLANSGLSPDQQFLLAHATRSYYGSTQLLDIGGLPYWIVNEGEYVMINTLDLSVDHVFWELRHNPWVIRNLLDNFTRYYSFFDQVKDPKTGKLHPGGISFCHDQGAHNQFSPLGRSSYELANLTGCFSHMTAEQLCNWVLIAASYVAKTADNEWLQQSRPTIEACLASYLSRDHHDPAQRNGVISFDSARCGTGSEITTYDSLDHSLAQSRNNTYMAVKGYATCLGLALLFQRLGDAPRAAQANDQAAKAAATVAAAASKQGTLPAVMEPASPGYNSMILPAAEGLVYPLFWAQSGDAPSTAVVQQLRAGSAESAHARLGSALRTHVAKLLASPTRGDNANRFPDGGIKLSSTSNNSWMSKIALFQHVARHILRLDENGAPLPANTTPAPASGFASADAAHVKWQTEGASAYWAMSDQMVSGVAIGSKYYPRCVTAVLWMP